MISASFMPFVVTADGALGHEANAFMYHLADKKFGTSLYAHKDAFCCPYYIWGSKVKWRRVEIEDVAGLLYLPE